MSASFPPGVIRATVARIDLDRLEANLRQIRLAAGSGTRVMAVVKADAYGHGAVPVARTLLAAGAEALGVALVEEGLELRRAGIGGEILVLGGVPPRGAREAVAGGLAAAVFDLDSAQALDAAALGAGASAVVHVKVDTGMSRLGVPMAGIEAFARALRSFRNLRVAGIFTALAAGGDADVTAMQIAALVSARDALGEVGFRDLVVHAANSSALAAFGPARLDLVRPGLALYGIGGSPRLDLKPVLALESEVAFVKELPAGAAVGYGGSHVCTRPTRLATLPVGYDDGLPRLLSNRGEALIGGVRVPIIGTVSMDLTTIDVTDAGEIRRGDVVVLIGEQGSERITAEEVALHAQTIPWEVLCHLGNRVPRIYCRGGQAVTMRSRFGAGPGPGLGPLA